MTDKPQSATDLRKSATKVMKWAGELQAEAQKAMTLAADLQNSAQKAAEQHEILTSLARLLIQKADGMEDGR